MGRSAAPGLAGAIVIALTLATLWFIHAGPAAAQIDGRSGCSGACAADPSLCFYNVLADERATLQAFQETYGETWSQETTCSAGGTAVPPGLAPCWSLLEQAWPLEQQAGKAFDSYPLGNNEGVQQGNTLMSQAAPLVNKAQTCWAQWRQYPSPQPAPVQPVSPSETPSLPAAVPGSTQALPNGWPNLNPTNCTTNCAAVATAMDQYLATGVVNPAAASPESPAPTVNNSGGMEAWHDENSDGTPLTPADIANELQQFNGNVNAAGNPITDWYGDGARGIVYVVTSTKAHEFNVIDKNGTVSAVDGQGQVTGSISDVAAAGSFSGPDLHWNFLLTYPESGF